MIGTLLKIFISKATEAIVSGYRRYVQTEHGPKSDICFVVCDRDRLVFYTSTTTGPVPVNNLNALRRSVGENILLIHGIPTEEDIKVGNIPYVYLCVMPSAIKKLGIKKSIELYKDWPGDSKVGDILVVRYK